MTAPLSAEVLYNMASKVSITTNATSTETLMAPRFPCVPRLKEFVRARVVEQPSGCLCSECKMRMVCKRGW